MFPSLAVCVRVCVFLQLWSKCGVRLCVGSRRVCTHCTLRHGSDPQWFPLNMLIEIAYKFTEHLCSSAMSKLFGRRCFRRAFHFFFFDFSLFRSLFSSNAFVCVEGARERYVFHLWCVHGASERKSLLALVCWCFLLLMYAFVVLSAQKIFKSSEKCMRWEITESARPLR